MKVIFTVTITVTHKTEVSPYYGYRESVTTPEAAAAQYEEWLRTGTIAIEDIDFTDATVSVSAVAV